jgi:hypothetical protein
MTEEEWVASLNSHAMLAALRGKGSGRLWRLFAVACARVVEDRMRDGRSRQALEVAERFADGNATRTELQAARTRAEEAARQADYDVWADEVRAQFSMDAAHRAVLRASAAADAALACVAEEIDVGAINEGLRLPDLIREVFGNPFRWTVVDPVWLAGSDGAARHLAHTIYDQRSFDLLPILADALEESGCADSMILEHLRGPGPHVRGCWVLDLVVGRE